MFSAQRSSWYITAVLGAALAMSTPAEAATLGWDITGGLSESIVGGPRANGEQFSLGATSTVSALGFWDGDAAGLLNAHTVQLWTDSGTLLGSAVVNNASFAVASTDTAGRWLFTSITPIDLNPGTYRIAASYLNEDDPVQYSFITPITVTSIGANWLAEAFSNSGAGTTAFPSNVQNFQQFGPNLLLASSVAEPASATVFAAALGVLGFARRRRAV